MHSTFPLRIAVVVIVSVLGAAGFAAISGARAEPPPAFDRALAERLVRAQEAQTRALEKIASAAGHCTH